MRHLFIVLIVLLGGCVATTKVVVNHCPQENLKYTIVREWKSSF